MLPVSEHQIAHNVDAQRERTILGALLLDGAAAREQCLRLRPEMFAITEYGLLFRRIVQHLETNADIDSLRLMDILEGHGESGCIAGGWESIDALTFGVPRRAMIAQHAEHLIELWKGRQALQIAFECQAAITDKQPVDEVLARLQAQTLDLVYESSKGDNPDVLDNTIPELEKWMASEPEGLPYGLPALDRLTGGMYPGEITVIGARNGVGKTAQIAQTVAACCKAGVPCDVFSLEMTRGQFMRRLWVQETWVAGEGVHQRILRRRTEATNDDRRAVRAAALRVGEWPLRIFDRSSLEITEIAANARVGIRKRGVQVVFVDYAQKVHAEGRDERSKVTKVSNVLTALAKDEGIHVVLLSQLRKVPHEQYSKAPTLADLRESSALGDDAHTVLLYHRGYDEETGGLKADGEVVVPKQRNGETRAVPMRFDVRSGMFHDAPRMFKAA